MLKQLQNILSQISRNPDVDNGILQASNRVILSGITQGLQVDRGTGRH